MKKLEEPYTRVSNRILEALINSKLNGSEFKIVLFIIRQTYGYQNAGRKMSLNYIAAGTKIKKEKVSKYVNDLVNRKILIITKSQTSREPKELKLNKNTQLWLSSPKREP